ncbi:phage holin family protein [Phormidesmis sp. 146-33]
MLSFFLTTLTSALGLLVVDLVVPGVDIATFPIALLAAISIGLVNAFVKPILSVLSLPVTFLTLGTFSLIVNGVCFWLSSLFVPGFAVHGLLAIVLAPIVLSFATTFLNKYIAETSFGQSLAGSNTAKLEAK